MSDFIEDFYNVHRGLFLVHLGDVEKSNYGLARRWTYNGSSGTPTPTLFSLTLS